ncbi:MAG: four-carbon acid sugar kinase family protein [Microvirga sp.]
MADDLTGALDATAPFAGVGLTTCVAIDPSRLPAAIATGAQVIAVSTGSRALDPQGAAAAVAAAVAAFDRIPVAIAFKKIDSRLKGHVAAEVQAALDGFRRGIAIVSPAIPELGRTVRDGQVRGRGVEEGLSVAASLGPIVERCRIPEVRDDDDAGLVADDVLAAPEAILAVGARGLADALARKLTAPRVMDAGPEVPFPLPRPILVGIGSRDPITLAQVDALRKRLGSMLLDAPDGEMGPHPHADGADVVGIVMGEGPARITPSEAAARFARCVTGDIRHRRPRSLVLSGGDSAAAVMAALGIGLLRVIGEILPGLPVCRTLDDRHDRHGRSDRSDRHDLTIVTKSGGFGAPDTLLQVLDAGT